MTQTLTLPRTLVLVDIENLMESTKPSFRTLSGAVRLIETLRSSNSQVIVAASRHTAAQVAFDLQWARWLWRSGLNGADRCLLEVLASERIEDRFSTVVLVSGDGVFAEPLARLAARGVRTHVLSHRRSCSRRLQLAANSVSFVSNTGEEYGNAA